MSSFRRIIALPALALAISSVGAVSLGQTANALEPMPLREAEQVIEQHSQVVAEKETILQNVSTELETLTVKKQTLEEKLESDKKAIEDLKQKIAEKKERIAAEKRAQEAREAQQVRVAQQTTQRVAVRSVVPGNGYVPGQCTYYVKNRRPDIGNQWGNANQWLYSAQAAGYATGSVARPGAIAVSNYENHVAYVESVSGNSVTISEMNYGGPWIMNTRTMPQHLFTYIY